MPELRERGPNLSASLNNIGMCAEVEWGRTEVSLLRTSDRGFNLTSTKSLHEEAGRTLLKALYGAVSQPFGHILESRFGTHVSITHAPTPLHMSNSLHILVAMHMYCQHRRSHSLVRNFTSRFRSSIQANGLRLSHLSQACTPRYQKRHPNADVWGKYVGGIQQRNRYVALSALCFSAATSIQPHFNFVYPHLSPPCHPSSQSHSITTPS
jgi:hypothetical protein